jgi:hypothetical protein
MCLLAANLANVSRSCSACSAFDDDKPLDEELDRKIESLTGIKPPLFSAFTSSSNNARRINVVASFATKSICR